MDSAERWADVADRLRAALTERAWTQSDLVRVSGLSAEGVRPVLKGKPGNYRPATLAKIAGAVGWTGDSIERILRGEDPVPLAAGDGQLEARVSRLEDQVQEALALLRRMGSPERAPEGER